MSRPEGVELVAKNAQQHGTVDIVVHAAAVYDAMTFEFGNDKGQGPLDGISSAFIIPKPRRSKGYSYKCVAHRVALNPEPKHDV